jgi:hypothetical protein
MAGPGCCYYSSTPQLHDAGITVVHGPDEDVRQASRINADEPSQAVILHSFTPLQHMLVLGLPIPSALLPEGIDYPLE